jgi:hypothetical protein
MNIMVTDNVRETQFTAGESSKFCLYCKLSEITATQKKEKITSTIRQLDISATSETEVMDNLIFQTTNLS